MSAIRRAEATWSGALTTGSGAVSAISSGAFSSLPVSWAARTESSDGRTSPEELVAAAHAVVLRHGPVRRARSRRDAAGAPGRVGGGHIRQARCRLAGRLECADGPGRRARACRARISWRPPKRRGMAARSAWRWPATSH